VLVGTERFCPPEVVGRLDAVVTVDEVARLQPRWDIFSAAQTSLDLMDTIQWDERRPPAWFRALTRTMQAALNGLDPNLKRSEVIAERVRLLHPSQHTTWEVQELSGRGSRTATWMMPLDEPVMTRRMRALAYHPALLRLKHVPQLMLMSKILPGGTHTRYEHSLGTYENVRRYLNALMADRTFLSFFTPSYIELALVAGLLSSVTQFPLSTIVHEIRNRDRTWYQGLTRESVFDLIMNAYHSPDIEDIVEHHFSFSFSSLRELLIGGDAGRLDEPIRFIHKLLNSSIDARVIDYLRRDSLHLGSSKGDPFGINDLLPHVFVESGELKVRPSGMEIVERIVTTRYWLHSRIYWDLPNRTMAAMVRAIFIELHKVRDLVERMKRNLLNYSEDEVIGFLRISSQDAGLPQVAELCAFLLEDRPTMFEPLLELNRAHREHSIRRICNGYEGLSSMLPESRLLDRLASTICELTALEPNRIHVLVDMPIERRMKLGDDIDISEPDNPGEALESASGIVLGVRNGIIDHAKKLRILIHPATMEFIRKNNLSERVREGVVRDLYTLLEE
jgi:hypothetical protein